MRKLIELVPDDLLRHEIGDARTAQDLRQRGGIAEDIGQPEDAVFDAEFLAKEFRAIEDLPHQRFPRGNIAVRPPPTSPPAAPSGPPPPPA